MAAGDVRRLHGVGYSVGSETATSPDGEACWIAVGARTTPLGAVRVWVEGTMLLAHRVVLFGECGPPPPGKPFGLHACGVATCIRPSHLYWGDARDNAEDARRHGVLPMGATHGSHTRPDLWARRKVVRGEQNHMTKMTTHDVGAARRLRREGGWTVVALAARYGTTKRWMRAILNGRARTDDR